MSRKRVLAIGLAGVVAASAAGWIAGQQIQSPAEIAANTAPPANSLISVPVEKSTLTSDVVARGTVKYGATQAVTLPKSAVKTGSSILTTAPVKGATVNEGSVAMTVSGRPVLILQGAQPAYRDIRLGARGTDVQQLQDALVRLGFDPGRHDGVYDGATAAAVAAWYEAVGFTPFGPTDEQLQTARAAALDSFGVSSERASADENLATAHGAEASANAGVGKATTALNAAVADQLAAQRQLDASRRSDPPPSPAELASLETAVVQANGAVDVARAEVDGANTEVANAGAAVGAAERRAQTVSTRGISAGTATQLGIQVPADEVLFFPSLPLRIDDTPIKLGEETTTGPVMTISNSQLTVDGALSVGDAKLVRPGAAVSIEEPDLGVRATGTVTTVADAPGTQGVDPARFYLQVTPTDAPASLVGTSVVLTVTVGSTQGDVLSVPVAALSVAADGTPRVQVSERGGRTRTVAVTPGLAAKGLVAVTPVTGRLAAGDLVVVGKGASPVGGAAKPKGSSTSTPTSTTTSRTATSSTTTPSSTTKGATRAK